MSIPSPTRTEPKPLIVIVEDDEDSRDVLRAVLEAEGFRVAVARNGRAALDLLRVFVPAVIVLDLRMPELDGWGFDRARAFLPGVRDVPVIVVSAFSHPEARLHELDAQLERWRAAHAPRGHAPAPIPARRWRR